MKLQILILSILSTSFISAQTKDIMSDKKRPEFSPVSITVGLHFNTYNKGLNTLNEQLFNNNIPTLSTRFASYGFGFSTKSEKIRRMFEIVYIESEDRGVSNQNFLDPKIRGYGFRALDMFNVWEKKKLSINAGIGTSINQFSFRLTDWRSNQSSFDSLIKYPSKSPASLDFSQNNINWYIDGRIGITYDTRWFPKVASSYEFSLFINFSQAIAKSDTWKITGRNTKIINLPKIDFSNYFIQFKNTVYFKL